MDAHIQLDVAELDAKHRRLSRDDAQRPQARDRKGRQIVLKDPRHKQLGRSDLYPSQIMMAVTRLAASFGAGRAASEF